MKSNIKFQGQLLLGLIMIALCCFPKEGVSQIIMQTKGENTPIRVYGDQTIKVYGGLKHDQTVSSDRTRAQIGFNDPGNQLILTDTLYNNTGIPLFVKTDMNVDQSHVIFEALLGNETQRLIGDSINFFKVTVDRNSSGFIILENDVFLRDTFYLEDGLVNLNDNKLVLVPEDYDVFSLTKPQPFLFDENYFSYIWDTLSGSVELDICIPNGEIDGGLYNFGGMGAAIQPRDNPNFGGDLKLRRTYNVYDIGTNKSIRKNFDIDFTNDVSLFDFKYKFNYLFQDLVYPEQSGQEANMVLYRSEDGGTTWGDPSRDTFFHNPFLDPSRLLFVQKDTIEGTDINGLWTLSPCEDPPVILLPDFTDSTICALDTFWLEVELDNVEVTWWTGDTLNPFPWVPQNSQFNSFPYNQSLSVEVMDSRGCISNWYSQITIAPQPIVDFGQDQFLCEDPTRSTTLYAGDEGSPFDYLWQNGATFRNFTYNHSPVGRDTIWTIVTYTNGPLVCQGSDSLIVEINAPPVLDFAQSFISSCKGDSIVLDAGQNPGANYQWYLDGFPINGADSSTYSLEGFVGDGEISVIADYSGSCPDTAATIVNGSSVELNPNHQNISCHGAADGSISFDVYDYYPDYIATFNGVEFFPNGSFDDFYFSNLTPGTYVFVIEDNCTTTDTIIITEPDAITSSTVVTDIGCSTLGQIDFSPTGGVPPYSFAWSNGATSEDLNGLTVADTYSVTLTDATFCTYSDTFIVQEFDALAIELDTSVQISCFGELDGQLTVNVLTGLAPYTYVWNNAATTDVISNLGPTFYEVTVTDGNNCTAVQSYTLQNPPQLVADYIEVNILCTGENNGQITAQNLGGTPPLTFVWSTGPTTQDLNNLPEGNYLVTITDAKNCTAEGSFTISAPAALQASINATDINCNTTGQLDLTPSGGVAPYTFIWSNGPTTEDQTTSMAGNYTVTVTDANNCTTTANATINSSTDLLLSQSNLQDVTCNGGMDGGLTLLASGGQSPFLFDIGNGPQSDPVFTDLAAGLYMATVTDANSCTDVLNLTIGEPTSIQVSMMTDDADCGQMNGSATATASGGTPPYTYAWPTLSQSGPTVNGLGAGSYEVIVTDGNNCTFSSSASISDASGPQLDPNPQVTAVTCNGGTNGAITVSATGGSGALVFNWDNGDSGTMLTNLTAGDYVVTVTDANGCKDIVSINVPEPDVININFVIQNTDCANPLGAVIAEVSGGTPGYTYNWNTGSTDTMINNLAAATYDLTITDANGCTLTDQAEVEDEGSPLSVTDQMTPVTCNGGADGSITLTVTTTGAFNVNWSTGQIGTTLDNLPAGTYMATVTSGACQEIVTTIVTEPNAILINGMVTNVSCNNTNDGAIDLTVSGGTGTYTFAWDSGQTVEDLINIPVGDYTVTVTDINMCTMEAMFTIGASAGFTVNATGINLSCFQANDGNATANVFGGLAPFTFEWSNGGSTQTINDLAAGTYGVTVTDFAGCKASSSVTLTEPMAIDFNFSFSSVTCFGDTDGTITITSSGGPQAMHQYVWNTGQVGGTINNLGAGNYIITITSGTCEQVEMVDLIEPDEIVVGFTADALDCYNDMDGSINTSLSGGVGVLIYSWNNGAQTEDLDNLPGGVYNLTVTDSNGCTGELTALLSEPDLIEVMEDQQLAGCKTEDDGWINLTVIGGAPAYTYNWSNGSTQEDINNLVAGMYTVTITDMNNCTLVNEIDLPGSPEPFEAYFLAATPVSAMDTIQFVDVSFPMPNDWNWNFGDPANTTSMDPNPEFFYPLDSTEEISYYDVQLVASSDFCVDTLVKTITVHNFRGETLNPDTTILVQGQFFERFKVYPNPTDGRIMVDIKLKQEGEVKLILSDAGSKRIRRYELEGDDEYLQNFDLGRLPGGLYLFTAKYKKDVRTVKLIVIDER